MTTKTFFIAAVGLVAALIGGLILAPSVAWADEEQFTTIHVENPAKGWSRGTAFGQEATLGGNVKVLLDSGSSGVGVRLKSHEHPFDEMYRLRLVAQEPVGPNAKIPRPRWPYTGVAYESMQVDFITADAVEATLIQTDRFQKPKQEGRVEIRVQATTSVDERRPPHEVRTYAFKVTLRKVIGLRPNGTQVSLGNFIVIFDDKVIFVHSPAKLPELVIPGGGCCGGGVKFPPEEIGASGPPVEAGTGFARVISTLASYLQWLGIEQEEADLKIPAGSDQFRITDASFELLLPPDFFGPGSEPFAGNVILQGIGEGTGDTIIQRLEPIEFAGELPRTDTIPVEMIQLNLVSVEPITITFDDGSNMQWNIQITLPDETSSAGEMTITETFEGGGTFDSFFDVWADVTFEPTFGEIYVPVDPIRSDPIFTDPIVTDPISNEPELIDAPIGKNVRINVMVKMTGESWEICPGTESDFCPGAAGLELEPDTLEAAEEIEKDINEKLPLWVELLGGIDEAFEWADEDGDGKLDEEEVTRMLKDAGVEIPWWVPWSTVSKHFIEKYDTDGDGKLDLDEFSE